GATRARTSRQRRPRVLEAAMRVVAASRRRGPQIERAAAQGIGRVGERTLAPSGRSAFPIEPVGDGPRRKRRARLDGGLRAAAHPGATGPVAAYSATPTWNSAV